MKISKLDQYVVGCVYNYPTLYHDKTYFMSKMKVLDQLLNTIGNGIRDDGELQEELQYTNTALTIEDIKHYTSGETVYSGYTEVKTFIEDGRVFHFPRGDSVATVVEADKEKYPEVIYWLKSDLLVFTPYPNFKKEYSVIYKCPSYMLLDRSFIEGAIEYYEFILEWFKDNESNYSSAFPRVKNEDTEMVIRDFLGFIKGKSNKEVSKDYGLEYNGDPYDFLVRRWQKEKVRIFEFIYETLYILKNVNK